MSNDVTLIRGEILWVNHERAAALTMYLNEQSADLDAQGVDVAAATADDPGAVFSQAGFTVLDDDQVAFGIEPYAERPNEAMGALLGVLARFCHPQPAEWVYADEAGHLWVERFAAGRHECLPAQISTGGLDGLVAGIDAAFSDLDLPPLLLGHTADGMDLRASDDLHTSLLGFVAPDHWQAIGIRVHGNARSLGENLHSNRNADPERIVVVTMLDRQGNRAGILRRGASAIRLPGASEGHLADGLMRALGQPTPPAPTDTVELWLRLWLKRLIDTIADTRNPRRFWDWSEVAALHPANSLTKNQAIDGPPLLLVDATRQLAQAWPWTRLRDDPDVLEEPSVPADIATWMDDGMFARWALGHIPDIGELATCIHALLLPDTITEGISATFTAAGLHWPAPQKES